MEYTNDGCLNLVIQTYYEDTSLSKDKTHKDYYLIWLENDMLFVINNNRSIHEGVTLKLIRDCSHILESFLTYKYPIDILENVKMIWDAMDRFQKQKMLRGHLISNSNAL